MQVVEEVLRRLRGNRQIRLGSGLDLDLACVRTQLRSGHRGEEVLARLGVANELVVLGRLGLARKRGAREPRLDTDGAAAGCSIRARTARRGLAEVPWPIRLRLGPRPCMQARCCEGPEQDPGNSDGYP